MAGGFLNLDVLAHQKAFEETLFESVKLILLIHDGNLPVSYEEMPVRSADNFILCTGSNTLLDQMREPSFVDVPTYYMQTARAVMDGFYAAYPEIKALAYSQLDLIEKSHLPAYQALYGQVVEPVEVVTEDLSPLPQQPPSILVTGERQRGIKRNHSVSFASTDQVYNSGAVEPDTKRPHL